ncbi:6-carboxy-5,6,7,8-tetrahydropterin synthase [hydrothermal vent metagenome]|uniref:6-carboxy-5,6,7,8-tetrahydropterin synthase n=1 Tax=hydrothermal vent metagenome TaxID=652676 RepID=A0A3B1D2X7_9ZZZZ
MFELSIRGDIAAAHFLRKYEGKCKNLHGHTWQIEVFIMGDQLDEVGMVVDFRILKKKLKVFLGTIDHICLNDLPYFQKVNPTTENLAKYIYENFSREVAPLKVSKVKAWESDVTCVTYYE